MANIKSERHLKNYCHKIWINNNKEKMNNEELERFNNYCALYYNLNSDEGMAKLIPRLDIKDYIDIFIQIVLENDDFKTFDFIASETIKEAIYLVNNFDTFTHEDSYAMRTNYKKEKSIIKRYIEMVEEYGNFKISKEFEELCEKHNGKFGLYIFYNRDKECVYIGKSVSNLSERVVSSFKERDYPLYVSFGFTKTKSDVSLYEVYYISKLKPNLNREFKHDDELTIELPNIEFTELVKTYEMK